MVPLIPSLTTREALLALTALSIGVAGIAKGHPSTLMSGGRSRGDGPTCTSSDGQPFGLIRGIALLNHSTFASFHVWLAAMLLQASSRWP